MNDAKSSTLLMWIEASKDVVKVYRRWIVAVLFAAAYHYGRETYWLLANLNSKHLEALALGAAAIIALLTLIWYERQR